MQKRRFSDLDPSAANPYFSLRHRCDTKDNLECGFVSRKSSCRWDARTAAISPFRHAFPVRDLGEALAIKWRIAGRQLVIEMVKIMALDELAASLLREHLQTKLARHLHVPLRVL